MVVFNPSGNSFLHGVRGIVYIDGKVAGAVRNVRASQTGQEEVIWVMGSRFPQAKELRNVLVRGTIQTLVFDPTVQEVMKLTDPRKYSLISGSEIEDGNTTNYEDVSFNFNEQNSNLLIDPRFMPLFDIDVRAVVSGTATSGSLNYTNDNFKGFKITNCMITDYTLNLDLDSFWLSDITFVADKIERKGSNLTSGS